MHRAIAGLLLGGQLLGCSDVSPRGDDPWTSSDSAGVRVTTSVGPVWSPSDAPQVSPTPTHLFGSQDGTDGVAFTSVGSGHLRTDGRIVLLDRGPMQVFVLDSTGSVETVIGRAGEGPGEFANPWQVHLYRDTIVMFDAGPKRISRFTLDGDLVDILTIQSTDPIWRYELTGPLDSGWVLSTTVFFPGVCTSSAMCQDSLPSLELDREGKATRSAVEAATNDMFGGLQGAGGHPFGSRSRSTVRGSDLVMGNGRALTVRVYSSVGVLKAIGRWTQVRRQVDPEDLEAFVDWRLERARTQGAPTELVEARYRGIDLPEFMPAFDQMHTDPRGWLWLEPWQPSHEERGTSWTVLGQNLEWLGTVEMPPNVNVLDIGETEVLGVWSDEFDVQFVGVWPLNR